MGKTGRIVTLAHLRLDNDATQMLQLQPNVSTTQQDVQS